MVHATTTANQPKNRNASRSWFTKSLSASCNLATNATKPSPSRMKKEAIPTTTRISQWFLCSSQNGTSTPCRFVKNSLAMANGQKPGRIRKKTHGGYHENILLRTVVAGAPHFMQTRGKSQTVLSPGLIHKVTLVIFNPFRPR